MTKQSVPAVPAIPAQAAPAAGSGLREGGLARSAGILGLGNIASRVIGLSRDSIISHYFGSSGALSAFWVASTVPTMIYDLLVGGMLSAALVPVFSNYSEPERRDELARIAGAVLSLTAIVMGVLLVLLEVFAEPLARLLSDFEDPALRDVLTRCLRIVSPAVLFFGLSGGVTGLLYSLRRFSYTAAGGAVFNLGIVIAAPLFAEQMDVYVLPLGIIAGSLLQLVVMAPGLRDLKLHFSLAWDHPAVQRILRLYVPIALGLIITQAQIIMDRHWASSTGAESISWMRYATTLIQMPLGLVPVTVSLAALPSLSRLAGQADWEGFRSILARGLRLVLLLIIPAAVGLWVMAEPIIRLLFEHGVFVAHDTAMTALALRLYLPGLLCAGVDFLLNYTFYARQDTRTPAIVGVVAVGSYFATALWLLPGLGFLGLVLADSVKQASHAAIMSVLLLHSVGRTRGHGVQATAVKAIGAALGMGLVVWLLVRGLAAVVPAGFASETVTVLVSAGVGGLLYLTLLRLLGVAEISDLAQRIFVGLKARR